MSNRTHITNYLQQLVNCIQNLDTAAIERFITLVEACYKRQGTLFVFGNGGSASTASHFAVDIGKGCSLRRDPRFRVQSLTDNVPWITALGNDLSFEDIFVEQMKNQVLATDLVVGISASGNSENVLRAVRYANKIGCCSVGLTGATGGELKNLVDLVIHVPTDHFGLIEDGCQVISHVVAYYFMDKR